MFYIYWYFKIVKKYFKIYKEDDGNYIIVDVT